MKYWENRQNCRDKGNTWRFIKKNFKDLLNKNTIIKIRLAVAENTSSLLKSNTKKTELTVN